MNTLRQAIREYLTMRRSLRFKLQLCSLGDHARAPPAAQRPTAIAVSPITTSATSTARLADPDQAIQLDPKFASAYSFHDLAHGNRRDFDRAMADLNKAMI